MPVTAHRPSPVGSAARRQPAHPRLTALLALLALASAVGACKKDAPPVQPPPAPKVATADAAAPPAPKVETVDLNALEPSLAAADANAALDALRKLDEALGTPGALAAGDEARARDLRLATGFALLARAAVGDGDAKAVGEALNLPSAAQGATPALRELAAQIGPDTATGKAAALVAWLTATPEQRKDLPAPDRDTWRSFARDDEPAGVAVRAATLDAVQKVLADGSDAGPALSPERLARAFGALLCARCAEVPEAAPDALVTLLYDPANRGYVCEPAAEKLAGAAPWAFPEAIAGICHPTDFGLSDPAELPVLTAGNAIALRALALALEARREPKDEKNPLAAALRDEIQQSAERLDALAVPLALPWLAVAPEQQTDRAAAVLPPWWLAGTGPERPAAPLETVVVDETGVAVALRPVAALRRGGVVLEDRAAGYAFPGKPVITGEAVAASDEARREAAKAAGEELQDADVITEIVAGVRELQQRAEPIAERAFAGLPEPVRNAKRAEGARTALVAVDTAAPAWLLRRALASLQAAGYRHPLVPRGKPADLEGQQVLPLVFRTTEGLPETVFDQRFERPVLVAVGAQSIDVYPPDKRREGAPKAEKPTGAPLTWPEGTQTVLDPSNNKLFSVRLKVPQDGAPVGPAVVQAVRKMAREADAGNVVFVIADDGAAAGRVLETVDALTAMEGTAITALDAFEPGLVCAGPGCPTHVAVLFPDVRRPRLKGEPKPPKETVATGPPGFCSKGNLQKVVTSRSGSFRFCYEKELQLNPSLSGRLTVQFTVGRDGTVPTASILSSTIGNRKVEECVLKTFRGMRFDKPQGGVCVVKWPLKFTN